jgi:hypothetical protein
MQAAVMHETGSPDVLGLEETERPEPGDGERTWTSQAAHRGA